MPESKTDQEASEAPADDQKVDLEAADQEAMKATAALMEKLLQVSKDEVKP